MRRRSEHNVSSALLIAAKKVRQDTAEGQGFSNAVESPFQVGFSCGFARLCQRCNGLISLG